MKSLLETMFGAVIGFLVMLVSVNLTDAVVATSINGSSDMQLDRSVRVMTDEMQMHLRNAGRVVATTTVGMTTYTTGESTLIVAAPAYNANQSDYFINGQEDTIIFTYDANNKEVRQVILPTTGAARPARNLFTIGRSVDSLIFTYNCREVFLATTTIAPSTYSLSTTPVTTSVKVYVNGTAKTATVSGAVVTVTDSVTAGDRVQIFYNPQTFSTTAPIVSVSFTAAQSVSGARAARTSTAQGIARMRNKRS